MKSHLMYLFFALDDSSSPKKSSWAWGFLKFLTTENNLLIFSSRAEPPRKTNFPLVTLRRRRPLPSPRLTAPSSRRRAHAVPSAAPRGSLPLPASRAASSCISPPPLTPNKSIPSYDITSITMITEVSPKGRGSFTWWRKGKSLRTTLKPAFFLLSTHQVPRRTPLHCPLLPPQSHQLH